MKNFGPWFKANMLWVIALAVAIIALPVALFFSFSMNAAIKKTVSDEVSAAVNKLQSVKVDYALPAVVPGQPAWSLPKSEPNDPTTRAVIEHLKRLSAESDQVRQLADDRNKAGKSLLVDGLFPQPADESARVRLLTEMTSVRRTAAEKLLEQAGAGGPPSAEKLLTLLQGTRDQEEQARLRGRVDQKLTDDEQREITEKLTARRLEYYQAHAAGLRFYAEPEVFVGLGAPKEPSQSSRGGAGGGAPGAGTAGSGLLPTIEEAWKWQTEYWVYQDVIGAVVKADTGPGGTRESAFAAPVKRVLKISVVDPTGEAASATPGGSTDAGAPAAAAPGDAKAELPKDFTLAHTGRAPHTGIYDALFVDVEVLADSARLPVLINAISTTNFMTVIGMKLESVDPSSGLEQGYYYGQDHLVKATLRIETIWLRSWIKPFMPKSVRQRLGIPDDPAPAPAEQPKQG